MNFMQALYHWVSRKEEKLETETAKITELSGETKNRSSETDPIAQISLLTPRENDLFLLLLEGYTLKESAKLLSVKYSTVNTHMTGIYKKLNVNSRAELIIRYRNAVKEKEGTER